MTKLHMVEFDGITFGMDAENKAAVRVLTKNIYYAKVTPRGQHYQIMRPCVAAKYVAAVMGEAAWLVTEHRLMETVILDNSDNIYIIYENNCTG